MMYWVLAAIGLLACFVSTEAVSKTCDPETEEKQIKILQAHNETEMRKFMSSKFDGQIGTIMLVNWQDQVLNIKSPSGKKCKWTMRSESEEEEKKFNKQKYQSVDLHAAPVDARAYYRVITCEAKDCIQFYNIFVRPLPSFKGSTQVYKGRERRIECDLKYMDRKEFHIQDHKPPFRFEWTGPRDCKKANWYKNDSSECMRYRCPENTESCKIDIDSSYAAKILGVNLTDVPKHMGYRDTTIEIESKKSVLHIKKASDDHDGEWRCIVYDALGISSHPTDEKAFELLEKTADRHLGILSLYCKDIYLAYGIPAGIIGGTVLVVLISILLCKQCHDYES